MTRTQRWPAADPPERKRLAVESIRPFLVAAHGQLMTLSGEAAEALRVEVVLSDPQRVAGRAGGDQVVPEELAQL